ncbi:MAG: lytic enzyme [Desulfobacterales bacterium GWB2_56_26]|nr:MAG: lytic enzyme [Desulfobacterales bacterium GWB2_56_26]
MSVRVTLEQIATIAPSARSSYREAFAAGQEVLDRFGISDTPLRVAHFMAQMLHESGAFTIQFENLNYSAERLPIVWPSRFLPKGHLDPMGYAHKPEKLANEVYGGRMGNILSGDGYKYRGRGLLQLTGKDSYAEATTILRQSNAEAPDFTENPDAVINAAWCLEVAASEWFSKGCNEHADQDSIRTVTKRINGGLIGLAERSEWLKRTKFIWR